MRLCAILLLTAAACSDPQGTITAGDFRGQVTVGDTTRTYVGYAPEGLAPNPALLLVFHGSGGHGRAMQETTGLDAAADARGFVVVYPDALGVNWAEGCGCNIADRLGIDDLGFVHAMIDDLVRRAGIDRHRVYAVGFSQGGLFVHRLACEQSGTFAGIASVASGISAPLDERCAPGNAVAVLVVEGALDGVFPPGGSGSGTLRVLGGAATFDRWASRNRCLDDAQVVTLADADGNGRAPRSSLHDQCRDGFAARWVLVPDGGHAWYLSGDFDTAELVSDFLLAFRR